MHHPSIKRYNPWRSMAPWLAGMGLVAAGAAWFLNNLWYETPRKKAAILIEQSQPIRYSLETHIARWEDVDLDGMGALDSLELRAEGLKVWLNGDPLPAYDLSPIEATSYRTIDVSLLDGKNAEHDIHKWFGRIYQISMGGMRSEEKWPEGFQWELKPRYEIGKYALQSSGDFDEDGKHGDQMVTEARGTYLWLSTFGYTNKLLVTRDMAQRSQMVLETMNGKVTLPLRDMLHHQYSLARKYRYEAPAADSTDRCQWIDVVEAQEEMRQGQTNQKSFKPR